MILVMDVGNTNTVLGVYEGKKLLGYWGMGMRKTPDEMGMFLLELFRYEKLDINRVEAIVMASVVPHVMNSLEHAIKKYFCKEPIVVGPGVKTGVNILYENPREVGVDRIVNAVAAYEIYKGPVVVVDFGTATTFCAISSRGEYLGGAISPGMRISLEALFQKTAKLPRIEIEKPKRVIGRNTVAGMQSGIVYGYIGQVDYIVKRMKQEMGEANAKVIATGGLAKLIAKESETIDEINELLTLEGLRIIYEKNKQM